MLEKIENKPSLPIVTWSELNTSLFNDHLQWNMRNMLSHIKKNKASGIMELQNFIEEIKRLLNKNGGNIYKVFITLAWLIKVIDKPNESSSLNDRHYFETINTLWQAVSDYYAPSLSQEELSFLLTREKYQLSRGLYDTALHHLLGRYKLESAKLSNEMHLVLNTDESYSGNGYLKIENILLNTAKENIKTVYSLPKPSEFTPNMMIISFQIPGTRADFERQVATGAFQELLPYVTVVQNSLDSVVSPELNLQKKRQWKQEVLGQEQEQAPVQGSSHALINTAEEDRNKVIATFEKSGYEITDPAISDAIKSKSTQKTIIAGISILNTPQENEGFKGTVLQPNAGYGREFFGVLFNHNNNLFLVSSGGKGSGTAILLEKDAEGSIGIMLFNVGRYAGGDLDNILPFSYSSFYNATMTGGPSLIIDPIPLVTMNNTRLLLSLAMQGQLSPHTSLIEQLQQLPILSPQVNDLDCISEPGTSGSSQPVLTFSGAPSTVRMLTQLNTPPVQAAEPSSSIERVPYHPAPSSSSVPQPGLLPSLFSRISSWFDETPDQQQDSYKP